MWRIDFKSFLRLMVPPGVVNLGYQLGDMR